MRAYGNRVLNRWIVTAIFGLSLTLGVNAAPKKPTPGKANSSAWEYNPGPDPLTAEGRAVIDIYAELPEYMEMSSALMEDQKFRYIFGLMMTRTYFEKNGVKILFIGQDATHIAEAAKQPGTSGFGARVQSIGNYFGADQSVATTNAFLSTIKGQYGAFDHVFIEIDAKGVPQIRQSAYVENDLWQLANGRASEIVLERERFWEWMIKNNPDSMSLMVTFGGAARDAWAEFLIKRGAKVGTRMDPTRLKNVRVPETRLVFAGGNNEFPVPVDKNGKDIYEILLGRKPNYGKPADQKAAVEALKNAGQKGVDMMVFSGGGIEGSGVLNAAQLGGYDLDEIEIGGKKTNSLKGLILSDGTEITRDIAFTASPHPSMLSKLTEAEASASLKKSFARLEEVKKETGWKVVPDLDDNGVPRHNLWDEGKDYKYGRADIRAGYFEFGAPDDRRVSRADASRLDPQTIIAGSRSKEKFDQRLVSGAKEGKPSKPLNPNDLWSVRPRQSDTRYIFDRGPGKETAKILMENLDRELIFEPKPGKKVIDPKGRDVTFETHGIDAYYTKTHPGTGFFGLHRGNFDTSRVLVMADPHGLDDWNTSRAMSGARGQYLNGLMEDLGFGEDYLVLKTVPVGMDGATAEEWEVVRERTEKYREAAVRRALENPKIDVIFTDGEIAKKEMERVLGKLGVKNKTVINVQRDGMKADSGIADAAAEAKRQIKGIKAKGEIVAHMSDLPRSHLPWWARSWEGTSGDLVIDSLGKARGGVRALITPNWVVRQKVIPSDRVKESIAALQAELEKAGLRAGRESVQDFLQRRGIGGKFALSNEKHGIGERSDGHQSPRKKLTPPECRKLFGRASPN